MNTTEQPMRLNLFLAKAGLGSRRSVEEIIVAGKVRINGEYIKHPAHRVFPGKDEVMVSGKKVGVKIDQYILFHKPRGFACTHDDPHAQKVIYDLIPKEMHHLQYAGRLDTDSEGMLLMSNDGAWLQRVTHPRYETAKTYEAEIRGMPSADKIERALKGVIDKGERLKIDSARCQGRGGVTSHWELILHEGKKREIRRLFLCLGHTVVRLKRVAIGQLRMKGIPPGAWCVLKPREMELIFQKPQTFERRPPAKNKSDQQA